MSSVESTVLDWFSSEAFMDIVQDWADSLGVGPLVPATADRPIFRSLVNAQGATAFPFVAATALANSHERLDTAMWQARVDVRLYVFFGLTPDMDEGDLCAKWSDVLRESFFAFCMANTCTEKDNLQFLGGTVAQTNPVGAAQDDEVTGPVTSSRAEVTGTVWVAYE